MKFKILAILVAIMLVGVLFASCDTEKQATSLPSEFDECGTESPTSTEPVPTEPTPTEPVPTEPTPTEPAPTEPTPTKPHLHSYGEWGVKTPVGCETDGVEGRTCDCGESEERAIPAKGHSYGEWGVKTPVGCETDGVEERTCDCGESEKRAIPAKGHSYGEWGVKTPVGCETDGVEERTCACGESEERAIPAKGHSYAEILSYDSTSHFYAATCGCENQKKDTEPHIDTDNDGKCEFCAYNKMPIDTTVDKFSDIMQNMFLGNTVLNETVMFIDYGDAKSLLFTPDRILAVKSFDEKTVYVEGKDYELSDGKLVILEGSSIPCITSAVYTNARPFAGIQLQTYINGVLTNTYWGEGNSMIKYQVKVDYEHSDAWEGFKQLAATDQYKDFIGKLERGEKVTVYFHGDSITVGANASGFVGAEPYDAPYPVMFVDALARLYGYSVTQPSSGGHNRYNLGGMDYSNGDTNKVITYINTAVGGDNSQSGASKIGNYINNVYAQYGCDLFIVAYGMNDGGNSPQTFTRANVKSIIDTVLEKNPDAAVMMISTMVPNPNAPAWNGLQREQEVQLLALAEEYRQRGVGCAVAQMTSVSVAVLEHKEFVDVTGNNINHPNDFLVRLYAQTMMQTLLGYENIV